MRKLLFIFAAVLLSSVGLHAGTQITYTASERLLRDQLNEGATTFGPAITSHTFSNGTGTIACSGEITKIDSRAFQDCSSLTSIDIPNSVTTIGGSAFQGCSGLTSIRIPSSVTSIGNYVFSNCNGMTTVVVENGNTKYDSRNNCNAIIETSTNTLIYGFKNTIIPNTITSIGDYAFTYCFGLTSINIPNSVTTLKRYAFFKCTGLKSVTIPSSVTTIGEGVFLESSSLTSIEIPSSVTSIGDYAFGNCIGLTSVMVNWKDAQSIVPINSNVFYNIANRLGVQGATLYVPGGTTNLYKQANVWKEFSSITIHKNTITYTASEKLSDPTWGALDEGKTTFGPAITKHEFSNGIGVITCAGEITKIGERAFYGDKMTSISIPNTIKTIEYEAFYACDVLTSIEIPNLVTSIGYDAFYDCHGLKTVYCYALDPPTVGSNAFANVPQDISVYTFNTDVYKITWGVRLPTSCFKPITAEVGGIKYEFFDENKARIVAKDGGYTGAITIPEKISYMGYTFAVTEIGQSAFKNCTGLTSVTIPKSVTTLGTSAFEGCSGLTSVTIPALVKEIKDWAFKNCTSLKDLNFADRTDAINIATYAFENMAIEDVVIPDWMMVIPEGLFYNNKKLKGIYLHEGVREIGNRPFGECPFEYIISMAQTPPTLIGQAFEGHNKDANVIVYVPTSDAVAAYKNSDWNKYFTNFITELEYRIISSADRTAEVIKAIPIDGRISIPAVVTLGGDLYNVAGIGNDVFNYSDKDNEDLQSISLPPTMQYIGDRAFNRCVKLTQIELPVELQAIGEKAFYGCTSLGSIVIPEGVQSIGKSAFMGCSKLTSISLSTGLKNIPDECFNQCPLGQEIIVPEGVETIGQTAFNGTLETRLGTKSITLPSTLKEINLGAFYYRDGLKEITCHALTPPTLTAQAFASKHFQAQQITVYVPDRDVMAKYKDDKDQWGSDIYQFKFADLMAEANKEYLRELAGSNDTAKAIANAYCDSIDNRATTTQQVQDYTNTAAMMMDKYVFPEYKVRLCDELDNIAADVLNAQPIADDYKKRIMDTHFRGEAENLFAEGCAKIDALKQLYALKEKCKNALRDMGKEHQDALKMANIYAGLIDGAATQEEVYQLYEEGKKRIAQTLFLKKYWKYSDGCYYLGGFIEER